MDLGVSLALEGARFLWKWFKRICDAQLTLVELHKLYQRQLGLTTDGIEPFLTADPDCEPDTETVAEAVSSSRLDGHILTC